jgi:hypothetical protein
LAFFFAFFAFFGAYFLAAFFAIDILLINYAPQRRLSLTSGGGMHDHMTCESAFARPS